MNLAARYNLEETKEIQKIGEGRASMGYPKGYCTPTTKISYNNEGDGPEDNSCGGGRPSTTTLTIMALFLRRFLVTI